MPYVDDSTVATPMSEENGHSTMPSYYMNMGTRHNSYTSHMSRISYTSHADLFKHLLPTKESQLRSRCQKYSSSPDYKIGNKEYVRILLFSISILNRNGTSSLTKTEAYLIIIITSFQDIEEPVLTDKSKLSESDVHQQQPLVDMRGMV